MEGRNKVTGRAAFAGDVALPGMLHTRLVLSSCAHANIRRLDLAAARSAAGVVLAVGAEDIAVSAQIADLLAAARVVYVGQPVAAVVAESEALAADAAEQVIVEYDVLPAVLDPELAMKPDAPIVLSSDHLAPADQDEHGTARGGQAIPRPRNCSAAVRYSKGSVPVEMASAEVTAEGRFLIPGVHQGFIETHVAAAVWEQDKLVVWTSTQGRFLVRARLAELLEMPVDAIRIEPVGIGGGFGGKLNPLLEPLVASLARAARRPVRLELTRTEEFLVGRGAPASVIDLKVGADNEGRLRAMSGRILFDCGAGLSGLGALAGLMVAGTYQVRSYELDCYDVATHKPPTAAYRAPAAVQAYFALESLIDELAEKLGHNPVEFRLRNASRPGDPRPDGANWPSIGLAECLERASRHALAAVNPRRGDAVGVAVGGVRGTTGSAAARCGLTPDGLLLVEVGTVDLTGSDTTLAMLAAEAFGIAPDQVSVVSLATDSAPPAEASAGSKVMYTIAPAVIAAATNARRHILELAADRLEVGVEDLEISGGVVNVRGVPGRTIPLGTLADPSGVRAHAFSASPPEPAPMFAVHLARVTLDEATRTWALTDYAVIQDVGRALDPIAIAAQIQGGVLQGIGRAIGEELIYDDDGQLRDASFVDYQLPTVDQAVAVDLTVVEVPSEFGPLGARGVGEPPVVPCAPAIANAIRRAGGGTIRRLPIRLSE